jgi:hypothetical protein
VASFTPRPLYLRDPLDRRLSDPRACVDDVEKRNFLTLSRLEL